MNSITIIAGSTLVKTPISLITFGWRNWPIMDASVRKSFRILVEEPGCVCVCVCVSVRECMFVCVCVSQIAKCDRQTDRRHTFSVLIATGTSTLPSFQIPRYTVPNSPATERHHQQLYDIIMTSLLLHLYLTRQHYLPYKERCKVTTHKLYFYLTSHHLQLYDIIMTSLLLYLHQFPPLV